MPYTQRERLDSMRQDNSAKRGAIVLGLTLLFYVALMKLLSGCDNSPWTDQNSSVGITITDNGTHHHYPVMSPTQLFVVPMPVPVFLRAERCP